MFHTEQRRGTTIVDLGRSEACTPAELLRVQRLARELRLTDQILSLDLDTLAVVPTGPAAAWTTLEGDKVSFAFRQMPTPNTAIDVAVWLGTNAHELGHVLFSPRRDSTLMYRVLESDRTYLAGIAMLHNIVEDQRQERLILARFRPWTAYLTAALGHHLRVDEDAWLLMAGRTWLPQDVRDEARAMMLHKHGQHVTDEVTRIVGAYQHLTDPGDFEADEAWQLLQELHALFADQMPKIPMGCTVIEAGDPETGPAGPSAPATADEAQETGDQRGQGDSSSDDDDDDDDGTDGDDDGDGGGDRGKSDDGDDQDQGSGGTGADDSPRPDTPPPTMTQPDVRRRLKQHAQSELEHDEEARDELDTILDALDHGRSNDPAEGADRVGVYHDATDAARRLHHDVADALLDLKDESEPGWMKRTDSGRLNIRRVLDPNADADTLFDRYEPGMMDASELDVILLLDVSGSMSSATWSLGEATWAIRHAVDDLEGRCTVLTYDSGPHRVLCDASERPDGRMFVPSTLGGTVPTSALSEAFRLMSASDAKNRLVIILTDGIWENVHGSEAIIAAMNAHGGITTVCALLDCPNDENYHDCQYGANIDQPEELARLFRRIAVERIRSWQ